MINEKEDAAGLRSGRVEYELAQMRLLLRSILDALSAARESAPPPPVTGVVIEDPFGHESGPKPVVVSNTPLPVEITPPDPLVVIGTGSLVPNGTLEIRPPESVYWELSAVYHSGDCELWLQSGGLQFGPVLTNTGPGAMVGWRFLLRNNHYFVVKSTATSGTNTVIYEARRIVL